MNNYYCNNIKYYYIFNIYYCIYNINIIKMIKN